MSETDYDESVFINCPFDEAYQPLFEGIVFAIHDCGYAARCAREVGDASRVRINQITQIIAECKFGVHDLSRTDLDEATGLPRFNMPLELGLFLGAKRFGTGKQARKRALVLDREPYRYRQFCSDIAGQDPEAHGNQVDRAVRVVRNWLRRAGEETSGTFPSGSIIFDRYETFQQELPEVCRSLRLDEDELIFSDFSTAVEEWLKVNAW